MVLWYNFVQKNKGALMGFDDRLERIRKKRKLTFNELAQMINVHSTQLRRYEKGESQPTLDVLRKLAIALNVPGDMLLFDEEEREPPEDFLLQFEAISKFGLEEKKIIKEVLDGLILKHEAKRWASAS
jgi:transcriptional regulator with XRE-family HTH domain